MSKYQKKSEEELRAIKVMIEKILKSIDWELDKNIYTATMFFWENGKKTSFTKRGTVQLSIYNLFRDHLVSLRKHGAHIEYIEESHISTRDPESHT